MVYAFFEAFDFSQTLVIQDISNMIDNILPSLVQYIKQNYINWASAKM